MKAIKNLIILFSVGCMLTGCYYDDTEIKQTIDDNKAVQDSINIKTSEMINKICEFCNKVGSAELIPLKLKDFKKQAIKSKYILKENKAIRINFYGGNSKVIRFDVYNEEKLRKLGCLSLLESCTGLEEIKEDKVIQGKF